MILVSFQFSIENDVFMLCFLAGNFLFQCGCCRVVALDYGCCCCLCHVWGSDLRVQIDRLNFHTTFGPLVWHMRYHADGVVVRLDNEGTAIHSERTDGHGIHFISSITLVQIHLLEKIQVGDT